MRAHPPWRAATAVSVAGHFTSSGYKTSPLTGLAKVEHPPDHEPAGLFDVGEPSREGLTGGFPRVAAMKDDRTAVDDRGYH